MKSSSPLFAALAQVGLEGGEVRVPAVVERDVRLGFDELEGDAREDRQRPVGAVQHVEQLVVPAEHAALAGAGDDLVLQAAVVEAAEAERHRLHRAAGDGATERDALQFGDDLRQEPFGQRAPDDGGERRAGLGHAATGIDVEFEDLVQRGDVHRAAAKALIARAGDEVVHAALVHVRGPVERANLRADAVDFRVVERVRGGSRHGQALKH